jgi:hypothetical protein
MPFSNFPILNLSQLFIDPLNKPPHYYSFVVGGSYAVYAQLEDPKNQASKNDQDNYPHLFSVGTNKRLIDQAQGFVGYWPFDEGSGNIAKDYSGNDNNGTLYSSTTVCSNPPTPGCPTWTTGKVGGALSFDGVDDDVYIPTINPSTDDVTLVGWIKTTDTTGTLFALGSTSCPGVCVRNGVVFANNNGGAINVSGTRNIADDNWHQFAVIIGSSGINIFVDGLHDGPSGSSFSSSGNNFGRIGLGTGYHCSYISGLIDDVRLYNRALSDSEIKALYEATK